MEIAGGLYREVCVVPAWDQLLGSGGRAAIAISHLSSGVILHSYGSVDQDRLLYSEFTKNNVDLRISAAPSEVAFAYFHPLSRPVMTPSMDELKPAPTLRVNAEAVLRFGFVEGDAIVSAARAVYDPQSPNNAIRFEANGSRADEVVVVLNTAELFSMTGIAGALAGAKALFNNSSIVAVIVKQGPLGATLFEATGRRVHVPAYFTERVFKIGTGDVFSSVFAHAWAERRMSLQEAANWASLAVASYVTDQRLPLLRGFGAGLRPVDGTAIGNIALIGAVSNLGKRYLFEEAQYCLSELGGSVMGFIVPPIDKFSDPPNRVASAVLVLADTLNEPSDVNQICLGFATKNVIVFSEEFGHANKSATYSVFDDFTSAIYATAWASIT